MNPPTRNRSRITGAGFDWGLLSIVVILWAIGLVTVFSASFTLSLTSYEDPYYFFVRQIVWSVVGMLVLAVAA